MKRICFLFIGIMGVMYSVNGQYNLVPNPSFEQYDTCPSYLHRGVQHAIGWTNPMVTSSPDYMNACDTFHHDFGVPSNYLGNRYAHIGTGYTMINTYVPIGNYREYIQTELISSLSGEVNYCIQFYVGLCDSSAYTCNNIGVYFSPTPIHDSCFPIRCNLPYTPQFENSLSNNLNSRNGWTLVSGTYHPTGGEKYIVIGNFRDSASSTATYTGWGTFHEADYYIDDVLITPCDSLITTVKNNLNIGSIKLFPTITESTVTLESEKEFINKIVIFSDVGKLVYEETEANFIKIINLNVVSLSKGLYFILINNKNNLIFIKS